MIQTTAASITTVRVNSFNVRANSFLNPHTFPILEVTCTNQGTGCLSIYVFLNRAHLYVVGVTQSTGTRPTGLRTSLFNK